jgi:hypothetical protein
LKVSTALHCHTSRAKAEGCVFLSTGCVKQQVRAKISGENVYRAAISLLFLWLSRYILLHQCTKLGEEITKMKLHHCHQGKLQVQEVKRREVSYLTKP